jgi:hypothetical protein
MKFQSPHPLEEDKYLHILIPSTKELIDFDRITEIAIEAISAYEERNFEDVLSQILTFGDLFKINISSTHTKKGSIPIDNGIILYKEISDLLVYSACSVYEPTKLFFRRKLDRAQDFVKDCLIGQSQYGSFVANIHCQLERYCQPDLASQPFGRKVILRILKGLENVEEAVLEKSSDPIVENSHEGLNANMCETLESIVRIGSGNRLNFHVDFEPKFPIPQDVQTEISLHPSSEDYLVDAAEILRGKFVEELRELSGFVFQLRRPEDERERKIKLQVQHRDSGLITVNIDLDEDSYQKAIDAHRQHKKIRVSGVLKKERKEWYLIEPKGLEIIKGYFD